MKIKEKLEIIRHYYATTRQVGHTTLMKEGTNNTDKKFVLVFKKLGKVFGCDEKDQVSWNNLKRLIGEDRPMVIDNGVVWLMLNEAIKEIERLEEDSINLQKIKSIIR